MPAPTSHPGLRLFFTFSWGGQPTDAKSFGPEEGPVIAGQDETAKMPLFGFRLPHESVRIAEWNADGATLYVPDGAKVELEGEGGALSALEPEPAAGQGTLRHLQLRPGMHVQVSDADLRLHVALDVQKERAGIDRRPEVMWRLMLLAFAVIAVPLAFLLATPSADLIARAMTDVRIMRGLPATPQPIQLTPEDGSVPEPHGTVIPATVHGGR